MQPTLEDILKIASFEFNEDGKLVLTWLDADFIGTYYGNHYGDHEGNHYGDHWGNHDGNHIGNHDGDHWGNHYGEHRIVNTHLKETNG